MKGLADIMLASGINRFVPHAFSPKEEDPDCYNGGKNVQYPYFKQLIDYMGRCAHVLSRGNHRADVAVFYNAEAEWSGDEGAAFFEICRCLTQNLIDFDIIPFDALAQSGVNGRRLLVNGEDYGALVISGCRILPYDRLACFDRLARMGLPVLFTNGLPTASAEGKNIADLLASFKMVPNETLPSYLREGRLCHVKGEGTGLSALRFYHVIREKTDVYLFSNEDPHGDLDAILTLEQCGECLIYDPWENRCYRGEVENGCFRLRIEKGNMLFVLFGDEIPEGAPPYACETERVLLPLRFDVAVREEGESEFRTVATDAECFDISAPDRLPHFSGSIRYRATFAARDGFSVIDLGQVGEVAEAYLNGQYLGTRINAPYKFDLTDALKEGENHLEVVVTGNLAHRHRDELSSYMQIPPTGIMGEIALCKFESQKENVQGAVKESLTASA